MTATRLTADQLNITRAEYDALIWVRDALDPTIADHDLPAWMRFDMNHWGHIEPNQPLGYHCGTACCIGGSMEMHMAGLTTDVKVGDRLDPIRAHDWQSQLNNHTGHPSGSSNLHALFYSYPTDNEDRTREKAVEAIDRFLAGNTENPWQV